MAHNLLRRVVAVWEAGDASQRPRRRTPAKKPIGLRPRGSTGLLGMAGRALKFFDEHVEEIALVVFFLAFVWFALDWLRIIMR